MLKLTRSERTFVKSLGQDGERIWADIAHWVVVHRLERSDRAVAILGASMLEAALEKALAGALLEHAATRSLFGRQGGLATFAGKADLAFAMGILSEWEWRDMDRIRRIRNRFAHELRAQSFDEQPTSQLCDALFMAEFRRARRRGPSFRRSAFTATCGLLAALLSARKVRRPSPSPYEGIRRHVLTPSPLAPPKARSATARRRRKRSAEGA